MNQVLKMNNLIKVKDEEQKKAINSWAKNKFTGTIIAGTGFGKSRCGCKNSSNRSLLSGIMKMFWIV